MVNDWAFVWLMMFLVNSHTTVKCHRQCKAKKMALTFDTPATYDYRDTGLDVSDKSSVIFSAQACNDINAALLRRKNEYTPDNMYEILIGGWLNTQSVIRRAKQGGSLVTVINGSKKPLSCNSPQKFWLSWSGGIVRVGYGDIIDQDTFMLYNDPSPIPVSSIGITTWHGVTGRYEFYLNSAAFPVLRYNTPNTYKYIDTGMDLSGMSSLIFSVEACMDANIGLSNTRNQYTPNNMYEILIGGWLNTKSVIRRAKQGTHLATFVHGSHKPLSCSSPRKFWVSWSGGTVRAGYGNIIDQNEFISFKDPNPILVSSVGITTWHKVTGTWEIPTKQVVQSKP